MKSKGKGLSTALVTYKPPLVSAGIDYKMSLDEDIELSGVNPFERANTIGTTRSRQSASLNANLRNGFDFASFKLLLVDYFRNLSFWSAMKLVVLVFSFITVLMFMSETVSTDASEVEIEIKSPRYIPVPSPTSGISKSDPQKWIPTLKPSKAIAIDDDYVEDEVEESSDIDDNGIDDAPVDEEEQGEDEPTLPIADDINSQPKAYKSLVSYLRDRTYVAVGDSLTKGKYLSSTKTKSHPYIKALGTFFMNVNTTVIERGSHGETAEKLVSRVDSIRSELETGGVVGVFSGSRDLLKSSPKGSASQVLKNLIEVHRIIHNFSNASASFVFTLAFQLPQEHLTGDKEDQRIALNKGIAAFQAGCASRVAMVDLSTVYNQTLASNARYWSSDYVHMSPSGYDGVGTRVYGSLLKFPVSTDPMKEPCNYFVDIV